jgi:UDP-GlcNAc:undecaprenyl-phosphate GlcNAc-1-phosphate transferase
MLTYILVFAAAVAFAIGGTPVARRLAHRAGMTDSPSARKVHTEPTPLLGGAAIYAAVLLALLLFEDSFYVAQLVGILVGATLVSFLGLWDDRRPLRPMVKLAGQVLATLVMVASGVQVALFGQAWLDGLVTVLWVVAVTNAVNFMDNMDGLTGGVAGIAAGYILLLAVMNDQRLVAPLAAAVAGACIGFLLYNFNPASIFMGDGGSLFLGFLLAALAIKLNFRGHPPTVTWMVPVLVLAVPLFDLTLVTVSRLRRRVNPFTTAGKDHLSHRLVRRGATMREAALALYLLSCAAGSTAILVSQSGTAEALFVALAAAALGFWGLWSLELRAPSGTEANERRLP